MGKAAQSPQVGSTSRNDLHIPRHSQTTKGNRSPIPTIRQRLAPCDLNLNPSSPCRDWCSSPSAEVQVQVEHSRRVRQVRAPSDIPATREAYPPAPAANRFTTDTRWYFAKRCSLS